MEGIHENIPFAGSDHGGHPSARPRLRTRAARSSFSEVSLTPQRLRLSRGAWSPRPLSPLLWMESAALTEGAETHEISVSSPRPTLRIRGSRTLLARVMRLQSLRHAREINTR